MLSAEVRGTRRYVAWGAASRGRLFFLTAERVLILHRLALVIAKAFHFTRDRFDSLLDVFLKVNFAKGHWEPYVGAGVSGIGSIAGFVYLFTPRWGLSLEIGYAYFVNGLAQHNITDGRSGVFIL
jgi:hypothetical protein